MYSKRTYIHRHNSFTGFVAMSERNMQTIIDSKTATKEAKDHTLTVLTALKALRESIKVRDDTWLNKVFK